MESVASPIYEENNTRRNDGNLLVHVSNGIDFFSSILRLVGKHESRRKQLCRRHFTSREEGESQSA